MRLSALFLGSQKLRNFPDIIKKETTVDAFRVCVLFHLWPEHELAARGEVLHILREVSALSVLLYRALRRPVRAERARIQSLTHSVSICTIPYFGEAAGS